MFSHGSISLPQSGGCSLSVFAVTDDCRGVSITGTKYELHSAVITNSFPIGVSNEWAGSEAVVSVDDGILAVMLCRMPEKG